MEKYNVEHYVSPYLTYITLHDKLRIGQLIFDCKKRKITMVDTAILSEIYEKEKDGKKVTKDEYRPLNLTDDWLIKIFQFEKKYLNTNNMTVFTSQRHGLKVHKRQGNYYLGYILREKMNIGEWKGSSSSKPEILFVNELMDYCYLLKRDSLKLTKDDLKRINEVIIIN
ncbi:hypothetical protein [Flagellimonas zhangzhouensis]|uniref:Uncharacterized protein n=1 Tax=Flagellimonas zhangzhouensis TaxID=1073328 RepID=A0A1H2XPJ0_9FLAO|nr:hypothetical protein [Allomuricauda zhangzhouensis]SDQ89868.1 hypothetical protein SAMN05216294_2765 [Allomuricauda zhangzhouensis]SDW94757.1 hypothetical protein SAMN04487892_2759 [Allomuricauda zhangzhouensis]